MNEILVSSKTSSVMLIVLPELLAERMNCVSVATEKEPFPYNRGVMCRLVINGRSVSPVPEVKMVRVVKS
jgi:hypothetical protein